MVALHWTFMNISLSIITIFFQVRALENNIEQREVRLPINKNLLLFPYFFLIQTS